MLTPDQITALRDASSQLVDPIVDFLIGDIAQRVSEAGQLTGTAAYQVWQAQKLGISQKRLKKEIQRRLKVSQEQAEQLLTQAAETGYDFDISRFPTADAIPFEDNTSLQQILDASVKLAQDDLTNITQTIGFITPAGKAVRLTEAYQQTCDFAFMKVTTGAQDYISAVREATRGLAEKGIQVIDYESGVHTSLEAAVRRNIMGGLGLMQEQISQQNRDDLGCDGWEISAHGGAAPDHEPIQGRQYDDKTFTRLNNSLQRRIGTLNCGHSAMPIIMGVNDPQYTNEELEEFRRQNEAGIDFEGKHYTLYEATQRQRSLERSIRKTKRKILIDEATGDAEKLQWDQIRLVRIREEYHRFSKAAGLPEQYERMEKAGFTWKHGQAAEKAEKTAGSPTVASEQSPRPKKKVNYAVDWDAVQSESYSRKFTALSENERANQAICTRARWALNNRDGVKTEEIYAVDMRTGTEIARITDQHYPRGVKRTKQFDRALQAAELNGAEVMLIHNHPGGSPPSIGDLNALLVTPRAQGVVVGHDGSVYWYSAPSKFIPEADFSVAYRKYLVYTDTTAQEKALKELSDIYGFTFVKL